MNETPSKFTLKHSYSGSEDYSPMDVTFEIPSDATIDQMLFNFECFLKACGFVFDTKFVQSNDDAYDLPEEEPEYGCMADKDTEDDESLSCCGKKPVGECCDSHEHYTDEWNEGTKNLAKELKAQRNIRDKACNRDDELKEFNEHWEKLSNEQRQKCILEALKESNL